MEGRAKELYDRLTELEKKLLEGNFDASLELQSHQTDIESLRNIVDEIKSQESKLDESHRLDFDNVGKEISATSKKLADLNRQLDDLESRTEVLEEHKKKSDNRVWSYIDKAIIAIISGVMTMLFNNL